MKNLETLYLSDKKTSVRANSYDLNNEKDENSIMLVGKALSSPIRIRILRELQKRTMNYSELSRMLDLPVGTIAFHISLLTDAGLISVGNIPEHKGHVRWCSYKGSAVFFKLRISQIPSTKPKTVEYSIPIGNYTVFEPMGEWGIASTEKVIADKSNNPYVYPPDKNTAQILWCSAGRIVYPIPTTIFQKNSLNEIKISLEISSCTIGYAEHYPSEITYKLNGVTLCKDISKGDFGHRYGLLTPKNWPSESSKYGILKTISIRKNGVFLNELCVNKNVTINNLHIADGLTAFLSIENDANCNHVGGFNLFGEKFGDYPQSIKINVFYD